MVCKVQMAFNLVCNISKVDIVQEFLKISLFLISLLRAVNLVYVGTELISVFIVVNVQLDVEQSPTPAYLMYNYSF